MLREMSIELINIDCMEYMATCANKQFDLAVVDVPYGIDVGNMSFLKEMNTSVKQKNGTRINGNRNKKAYTQKDWDKSPPTQEYFDELRRVSQHQIIFGVEYVNWTGLGNGRIKWNKGFAEGVSFKGYEMAYCSLIDYVWELDLLWAGMCQAKSLAEPMVQQGNKKLNEKRIHPCHKPINLYKLIFETYAKKGMNILDTHLGSGSSAIAAHYSQLHFVGCEIDEDYYNAAFKRFNEQTLQKQIVFPT